MVCPPWIGEGLYLVPEGEAMGRGCPEKSRGLAKFYRELAERQGCAFLDAEGLAEFNRHDCMHLTRKGHSQLAEALAERIPALLAAKG